MGLTHCVRMLGLALVSSGLAPAIASADPPPQITASFSPTGMLASGQSTLTITITNPASSTVSSVGFTDSLPSNLVVSTPNGLSNSCGSTATASAGSGTVSLSGGDIAAHSSCHVAVNVSVTSTATGSYPDSTGPVSSSNGSGASASAALYLVKAPTISTSVSDASPVVGQVFSVEITIANPNSHSTPPDSDVALSGVGFEDPLPRGLTVANPADAASSCGGILTAIPGSSSISLAEGNVPTTSSPHPGTACFISVDVQASATGTFPNTTDPVSAFDGGAPGGSSNPAYTTVGRTPQAPTLSEAFRDSSLPQGQTTSLSFTLANPNARTNLGQAGFTDTLPAGLRVASPANSGGTCISDWGGELSAPSGQGSVSLSAVDLAADSSCTLTVDVTGTETGALSNPTGSPVGTYSDGSGEPLGLIGAPATASLIVGPPGVRRPTLAMSFASARIHERQPTNLIFYLADVNPSVALTGVGFTDVLPPGLVVTRPAGVIGTCGGRITAVPGATSISLRAATLHPRSVCAFAVDVTALRQGTLHDRTDPVGASNSRAGAPASAAVHVLGPERSIIVTRIRGHRGGIVSLDVTLHRPGDVDLVATALRSQPHGRFVFARQRLVANRSGTFHITVTPNARGRKMLRQHHTAVLIRLSVTYTATGTSRRAVGLGGLVVEL